MATFDLEQFEMDGNTMKVADAKSRTDITHLRGDLAIDSIPSSLGDTVGDAIASLDGKVNKYYRDSLSPDYHQYSTSQFAFIRSGDLVSVKFGTLTALPSKTNETIFDALPIEYRPKGTSQVTTCYIPAISGAVRITFNTNGKVEVYNDTTNVSSNISFSNGITYIGADV